MIQRVEKWREIVLSELRRGNYPLPPDLVLAVIKRESNGSVGVVNPSSGASGLMQVMPIALRHYNENHSQQYTMADLRSKTSAAAKIQIRIGIWILAFFWKSAYRYLKSKLGTVPLEDLCKVADFFYAAGPGNAKRKLDQLPRPTYVATKRSFPNWDRIVPAQRVWDFVQNSGAQWDISAIDRWLSGEITDDDQQTKKGAAIAIVIVAIAMWYMSRKE